MEKFRKLGLGEHILQSLKESGFESPKEIQEKAIPLALAGHDLIGGSATGSGKTLAFGASIIEKTEKGKGIQALILEPTRELAEQVAMAIKKFAKHKSLAVAVVYGGVGIGPQVWQMEKADIVVGTPGRLLDHLERRTLNLSKVKTLVLDEADRMLDMGFIHDVEKIINQCPKERQTFLFSATISPDVEHIAKKYMKNPINIAGEEMVDPSKLKQIYYDVQSQLKFSLLVHLLKYEKSGLVMVFCNTRRNADFVASNLKRYDIDAVAIHGGLTQSSRTRVLERFKSGALTVLVCTDVAARGLDIPGVSHVYNYDIPKTGDEYIHRIGRTARAGKEGIAVSIVSNRDYENFRRVLHDTELEITLVEVPKTLVQVSINFGAGAERGRSYGGRGERGYGGRGYGRSEGRGGYGRRAEGRGFGGRGRSYGRRDSRREESGMKWTFLRNDGRTREEGEGRRSYGGRGRGERSFGRGRSSGYSRGRRY